MLQIKYYPGEGYNYLYMPDYRFYCDEKIHRPLSSFYDYPFKTRIWVPYKNLRLYFDYFPSRIPFREQRVSWGRGYSQSLEYWSVFSCFCFQIRRVLYHQRLKWCDRISSNLYMYNLDCIYYLPYLKMFFRCIV